MFKIHTLVLILIASTAFILMSCGGGGDDGYCGSNERREQMGIVPIDSAFRVWLSPPSLNQVFRNSSGGSFSLTADTLFGSKQDETLKYIWGEKNCDPDIKLTSNNEYDYLEYSSPELPFTIRLYRELVLNYDEFLNYHDKTKRKSEQIDFYVGYERFSFKLSDTSHSYLDQYTLLDSVYTQVLVCENTRAQEGLYPVKFMLQKGQGLIGFELSNNEIWAKQK